MGWVSRGANLEKNDGSKQGDAKGYDVTPPRFYIVAAVILMLGVAISLAQGIFHIASLTFDELSSSGKHVSQLEQRWGRAYLDYLFVLDTLNSESTARQRLAYVTAAGYEDFNALLIRALLVKDHSVTRIEPLENESLEYLFKTYHWIITGKGVESSLYWTNGGLTETCQKSSARQIAIYRCD